MIKFWRRRAFSRVLKLEKEFQDRSDLTLNQLQDFQRRAYDFSEDYLYEQRILMRDLIGEARGLSHKYLEYFTGKREDHPNYCQLQQALHNFFYLIDEEIKRRDSYNAPIGI
ncbi:MAG: hypothetical protein WC979_05675 [Candidatus Pacearchaeota archaeon]|jgi:hypothetical protein